MGVACTLRKTNSQPASMMLSTLSQPYQQYSRMTSDPQSKTSTAPVERVKSDKSGSSGAEKVKSLDIKSRRSGSPQQSKRTIFSGLRSSLSRLSKTPSHEDLIQESSVTTDTRSTTGTTTTAAAAEDDDDE